MTSRLPLLLAFLLLFPLGTSPLQAADEASLIRVFTREGSFRQDLVNQGVDVAGRGQGWIDVVVPRGDRNLKTMLMGQRTEIVLEDVHAPFEAFRDLPNLGIYHTIAEIQDEVKSLAEAHPEIMTVEVLGKSIEGRDLQAVRLCAKPDSANLPAFLFLGAVHAREWIGNEVVIALMKRLVEGHGNDPAITRLLDEREIWIVPVGNPDGVHYSQTEYKMWRKNRRVNANGSFGVDLNRNWGYEWGGPGSSSTEGSDTYHGTGPFSEPETAAIRDLTIRENFVASIACHSYSELVLWPYGCTESDPIDLPFLSAHGQEMARMMGGYTPEQASDLYVCCGISDDWFYGERGMLCYTFEFAKQFIPNESDVPAISEGFVRCGLYLLENAAEPFPLLVHQPLDTTTDTAGPYQVTARFNRRHHGNNPLGSLDLLVEAGDELLRLPMTDQGDDLWATRFEGNGYGHRRYRLEAHCADGTTATFPQDGGWYGFDVVETLYLLVDDDRGKGFESYYLEALKALNLHVRVWDRKMGCPDEASLVNATAVLWFCGSDSSTTLEAVDQKTLRAALNRGARLLLFGQDIGYDLKSDSFYGEVLRAEYYLDKSGVDELRGMSGTFLADRAFSLAKDQDNQYQAFPEVFRSLEGAEAVLEYVSEEAMLAAHTVETPTHRLAYFGFGLEGVGTADARKELLAESLAWLEAPGRCDLHRATSLGTLAGKGNQQSRQALDAFWSELPERIQEAGPGLEIGTRQAGVNRLVFERYRSALRRARLLED